MKIGRREFLGATALALANTYLPKISAAQAAQQTVPRLRISNVITRGIPERFQAYYLIESNTPGRFMLGLYKERLGRNGHKISTPIYDLDDKKKGRLFTQPTDPSQPVAVIDGRGGGIEGVFEIHDDGSKYISSYPISPALWILEHSEGIATNYIFSINNSINKIPSDVVGAAARNHGWTTIGKGVDDTYYWLYSEWKNYDDHTPIDPNKPWLEKKDGVWVDNRRFANFPGLYDPSNRYIVIPQTCIEYGTKNKILDRNGQDEWNQDTVFHEFGHLIDDLPYSNYSDSQGFITVYDKDKESIPENEESRVAYFLKDRWEPFAEVTGALMGGLSSRRSARILSYFYNTAEYIRTNVLPRYGYRISPESIRRNIYSGYGGDRRAAIALYPEIQLASSLQEDIGVCPHIHAHSAHQKHFYLASHQNMHAHSTSV